MVRSGQLNAARLWCYSTSRCNKNCCCCLVGAYEVITEGMCCNFIRVTAICGDSDVRQLAIDLLVCANKCFWNYSIYAIAIEKCFMAKRAIRIVAIFMQKIEYFRYHIFVQTIFLFDKTWLNVAYLTQLLVSIGLTRRTCDESKNFTIEGRN